MRVRCQRFFRLTATAAWIVFLCAGCVQNDETPSGDDEADATASVDPIARGMETYQTHCASCHGPQGKGNGPVADALTTMPADLTMIRARDDGSFVADSVYAYLDGRKYVQAHGTRDLPVWGNIGTADGAPVRREDVDERVRELVEYISSIQSEPIEGV